MGYIQLRNYAEWYYTKYFPSKRQLYEKLLSRSEEESGVVERIMADLADLIVEDKVIESRIHAYLSLGKTERYIRTKLMQKKFDKNLVDAFLSSQADILKNPETYRSQIEKAIQKGEHK